MVLGGIAALAAIVLIVYSGDSGWGFVAAMSLLAGLSVVLLIRPHVRVSIEGVAVHNPFRQTFVPWRLVEDVGSRWNLEVYAGDRTVRAWAISNSTIRSGLGSAPGLGPAVMSGVPGVAGGSGAGPAAGLGRVAAPRVARLIEASKADWLDAVASGAVAEPAHPRVVDRWDPVDLVLGIIPAVAVLVTVIF